MQSTIQQSSWHSFPAGASYGRGSVSSDHAHGDADSPGESGLQFPGAAAAAAAQWRSGRDIGNRTCTVISSTSSPQQTHPEPPKVEAYVSSRLPTRLIPRGRFFQFVLKFYFKMFARMRLNTKLPQNDLPEMSSCRALLQKINHLSFQHVHCYFIIPHLKEDNAGVGRHFILHNKYWRRGVQLANTLSKQQHVKQFNSTTHHQHKSISFFRLKCVVKVTNAQLKAHSFKQFAVCDTSMTDQIFDKAQQFFF